jgi:hypothetical protein
MELVFLAADMTRILKDCSTELTANYTILLGHYLMCIDYKKYDIHDHHVQYDAQNVSRFGGIDISSFIAL